MLDEQPKITAAPRSGNALLRVIWTFCVPATWLCVVLEAHQKAWTFGPPDVAIVVVLLCAIVARAIDALYFRGTTADGRAATWKHVVGYAFWLVLAAAAGWLFAQWIGL